ncbi:hypothetical protein DVH24_012929 [Malus domestica]|uniref:Uncharacterized protein n=1 Tax=Malus domestica TaxID=3750 RepID=A0A498HUJ1_MALDO|nr:hypothetical protein DVH24_012929 [Malus domestica]
MSVTYIQFLRGHSADDGARQKNLPPENGRVIAAETLPRKPSSIDEGGGNDIVLRKLTEISTGVITDHFMVTVSFADVEVHSYTRATLEKAWALINLVCSYVAIESSN